MALHVPPPATVYSTLHSCDIRQGFWARPPVGCDETFIKSEQFVQVGRSSAPLTVDENRRPGDFGFGDASAKRALLDEAQHGIDDRVDGHLQGEGNPRRRYRKTIPHQQSEPRRGDHSVARSETVSRVASRLPRMHAPDVPRQFRTTSSDGIATPTTLAGHFPERRTDHQSENVMRRGGHDPAANGTTPTAPNRVNGAWCFGTGCPSGPAR